MTRLTASRAFAWLAVASLAGALPVSGCAASAPSRGLDSADEAANARLVVVHTTDIHGAFGSPEGADPPEGARALSALIAGLRAEDVPVVVVDSGDMWSGTLLSDHNRGALGVALFNAIGYDAVALGNHEFDYGPAAGDGPEGDAFGALRARLAEAEFPMLAANLIDRETGALPDWPGLAASVMVRRGDLNVGLVGVLTQHTPQITMPFVGARLAFTDPATAVAREAHALRARGADLVVALAHLGGACEAFDDPRDVSRCLADSELFDLARHLPSDSVDLLLGGHTHRRVAHVVDDIPVVQPAPSLSEVAVVHLARGPESARFEVIATLVPLPRPRAPRFGPAPGPHDPRVEVALAAAEAQTGARRGEVIGPGLAEPLARDYRDGSPVGAVVCDALLAAHEGREICLYNGGGLRADLAAGPMTFGALYDLLPFGNAVATLDVTGAQLRELVRIGAAGVHGMIQVGGLRVTVDRAADPCPTVDRTGDGLVDGYDRDRVTSLTLADGAPIDDERVYRVVTNAFVAAGGDGFGAVTAGLPDGAVRTLEGRPLVRDRVAAWFRAQREPMTAPPGWRARVAATGEAPKAACGP